MYGFLILLSQWPRRAVSKAWIFFVIPVIPGLANLIPDWVGKNSRFALPREFACKTLIWLAVLVGERPFYRENRRKSRYNGKKREFASPTEPAERSIRQTDVVFGERGLGGPRPCEVLELGSLDL